MEKIIQNEIKWLNDICQDSALCKEADELLDSLQSIESSTDEGEVENIVGEFANFVKKLNRLEPTFVFAMLRGDDGSFHIVAKLRSSFINQSQIIDFEKFVSCMGINYHFSLDRFGWNWKSGDPLVTDWRFESFE